MSESAVAYSASSQSASVKQLVSLLKPGVMLLVVFTGIVGMLLAPTASAQPIFIHVITLVCIALGSGSGAMINMWYDRDIDQIMKRTSSRPIPAGLVNPDDVLAVGLVIGVFAVMLLGLATNWLAGGMLAFAIFFYGVIYTMLLKRSTDQNIVIGGAAGAFPPVIGWLAMSPEMAWQPWLLFAIIFFWTPPHFWALALYRHDDYRDANIPMLPVSKGLPHTAIQMEIYCWLLAAICMIPWAFGMSGAVYAITSTALNIRFILHARGVRKKLDERDAKRMFGFSILYLFALFAIFVIDRWVVNIAGI
ncbi:MAG: heme o synthase [Rickettsiales bacterium]|nr:heme o synthase [Rickettsiales bacterium]